MTSPETTWFLIKVVNGQPPHMMAAQNVIGTETMAHIASIGVGGLTAPPTVAWCTAATITPTASANIVNRIPLTGSLALAAKAGCLVPQVTAMTIWIGITQRR